MTLQVKFFSIPIKYEDEAEAELNAFLKTVRLITLQRELVCQENRFYWAIAVEYMEGNGKDPLSRDAIKKKIDYKETLSPENFAIFARLRDWRKETAAREAVQVYNVFMNDQLAAMVEKRITTKKGLGEIEGVGDARVEKYGDAVLAILKEEFAKLKEKNETGQESLPTDPNA
ncbi:MAG: HRDC domain-containing protein [SAR324 cluster bacterium]|nr:HRDC domain-containing protein [SAR324 cluster bacterium]